MSDIRIRPGKTGAENMQLVERAEALGLKIEHCIVDDASTANVKGGRAAVEAVMSNGRLDGDGLAQLRKAGFVAGIFGKDLPISDKHTRAVKALSMQIDEVTLDVQHLHAQIGRSHEVSSSPLRALHGQFRQLIATMQALVGDEGRGMARVDPKAARQLGEALPRLASATAALSTQLSTFRTGILKAMDKTQNDYRAKSLDRLQSLVSSAIEFNDEMQQIAPAFGPTAPPSPQAASAAACQLADQMRGWVAEGP